MTSITGIDISEFQGQVDWTTLRNHLQFVIIRATIGTARVDNWFTRNRDLARLYNIPLGFYHYAYPQYNSPQAEADFCCAQLADIQEGELIVLDFEETWSGDSVAFCRSFLDRVAQNLGGYKALIYLNQSQLTSLDWKPLVDTDYGLWVAAYTYDPTSNNFKTGAWKTAAMQQYTSSLAIPGVSGNVDGDVFFGDANTFKKYGYQKTTSPTPPSDIMVAMPPYLAELFRERSLDPNNEGAVREFWQGAIDAPGLKLDRDAKARQVDDLTIANNQQANLIQGLNQDKASLQDQLKAAQRGGTTPVTGVPKTKLGKLFYNLALELG